MGLCNKKKDEFIQITVKPLLDWHELNGEGCMVSNKITKEGFKVGYMYREVPMADYPDRGWRFLAGDEDDDYMNNSNNHHIFALNTICNYDNDIIPYLHADIGSVFIRINSHDFERDDNTKPIYVYKQSK